MSALRDLCPGCFQAPRSVAGPCQQCGFSPDPGAYHSVLSPLTVLDERYLVGRVLGKPGGFGVTYLAFDQRLHRRLALKELMPRNLVARRPDGATLHPHTEDDADLFSDTLTAFLNEARTLAKFSHPNLVRVLDYFEGNGTAYFTMEYYEGQPLSARIRSLGRPLTADEALEVSRPLLRGLDVVHGKGILHRDIKPSNIYLTRTDSRPVLLDFGSARQTMGESTRTLTSVLTPGYAPFEQYHGRGDQGPWTDVYGVAATLYFLVTGHQPPEAGSRIEGEPLIPPHELVPDLPEHFSAAIVHGLALRPQDRPRSARDCLDLLTGGTIAIVQVPSEGSEDRPTELAPEPGDATVLAPREGTVSAPAAAVAEERTRLHTGADPAGSGGGRRRWTRPSMLAGAGFVAVALPLAGMLLSIGDGEAPDDDPVTLVGDLPTEEQERSDDRRVAPASSEDDGEAAPPQSTADRDDPSGSSEAGGPGSGEAQAREPAAPPERDPASTPTATVPSEPGTGAVVMLFGDAGYVRQAESGLLGALLRVPGVTPVDAGSLQIIRGNDRALQAALAGDISALAGVAGQQGAEWLVVGELATTTTPARGSFHSGSAQLDLKMYQVSSGALVDAALFTVGSGGVPAEVGTSPSAAASNAAQTVAEQGADAIARWVRRARR